MKNAKESLMITLLILLLASAISEVFPIFAYRSQILPKSNKASGNISPPITTDLSLKGISSLGEEGELLFTVVSSEWLTNTEIKVLLPSGFSRLGEDPFWNGNIPPGQTISVGTKVKAVREGEWIIEGNVISKQGNGVVLGKSDLLYVSVSKDTVRISETNPKASNKMESEMLDKKTQFSSSEISPMSPGTVTVYGWWYFYEEDGTTLRPARRARVELWEDDWPIAYYLLATTYTDNSGYYEFPAIDNNDGLFQNGLDVWVKIFTDDSVVWVSDNSWPSNLVYWGQTNTDPDVADGWHSMGSWVMTGDNRGAMGIFDTILIGYDYASSLGYNHAEVHARWRMPPPSATELDGVTINLEDGDEWDEDVILHEYGHSVQHGVYGEWIPDSGGPHWPMNPNFAFSEGWPTFWGVATNLEMGYGDVLYPQDAWYRDHDNQIIDFDLETNSPWPGGDDDEFSIARILWDIYDFPSDGRDNLGATMTPIWDVFRNYITNNHHAYTIHEFWNGWMARGWDATHDMWGIYRDHGVEKDVYRPTNPTGWSGSHSAGVWSNDNTIYIQWWGASDDISGVYGYSFVWDTSAGTVPDTTVDTTNTMTTSPPLADGSSCYLHVRTQDYAGRWASDAFHIGPFYIDTAAPSNPTGWSSSHTVRVWSSDNTIEISWSGASDSLSGVYGYSLVWDTSSTTIPDTTVDTTGTSTTSSALASGGSWYFHIRTRDSAGNWNPSALHLGPFYIDTTPPSNPTGWSSSHSVRVWSSDNTVYISWSGASDTHSGVYGYSFVWDTLATTIPDTTVDTTGTSTTSSALSSGSNWYFHVRTRDNVGNWNSGAFHVGPFYIDTVAPSTPGLFFPWNGFTIADSRPAFTWTVATDSHSGLGSYTLQLDTSTSFNSGNLRTYTGIATTTYEIPTALLRTTWYWRTLAADNAGNNGAYSSYRSIIIDKIGTHLAVSVNPSSIKLKDSTTISGRLIPETEIIIESTAVGDTYARFHGMTIDETLVTNFWTDQPSTVIGTASGSFYYVQRVFLAVGSHYVTYGVSAYVGHWHVKIYINGVLAGEGDTDVYNHFTVGFNVNGLGNRTINLTYSKDGGAWTSIANVNTDSSGYYSYVWKPTKKGNYVVKAAYSGNNDYYSSSATANLSVT